MTLAIRKYITPNSVRDYISAPFKNLQEAEEIGIGGFTAVCRLREKISKQRAMPTTYLEDGTHINDHIIRDPLTLSIEGVISDIFIKPNPLTQAIAAAQTQVGAIAQYLPNRTQSEISRINKLINRASSVIDKVDSVIDQTQRLGKYLGFVGESKGNIDKFIDAMVSIYDSNSLIKIDTLYRSYENMSMKSLDYERDNQTKILSFTMEFQQARFSESIFAKSDYDPAAANNGQQDEEKDKGAQEGKRPLKSFAYYLKEVIGRAIEGGLQ